MTPLCLACGAPIDANRYATAQTCNVVCRNRLFRGRRARLAALVKEQSAAIAAGDYEALEDLLAKVRAAVAE